jgi:hypothetical protein
MDVQGTAMAGSDRTALRAEAVARRQQHLWRVVGERCLPIPSLTVPSDHGVSAVWLHGGTPTETVLAGLAAWWQALTDARWSISRTGDGAVQVTVQGLLSGAEDHPVEVVLPLTVGEQTAERAVAQAWTSWPQMRELLLSAPSLSAPPLSTASASASAVEAPGGAPW